MITASIVGPTFITVMMNGVTNTINSDHANYADIREALKTKDHETVEKLINVAQSVINYVSGRVRIVNEQVFYGDFEVKGSIVQRIIAMMREGFDAESMIKFLENLMSNPSKRAVDELYGFLEATALPITEDGCFLAYKRVRDDYRDFYTGKMDNSIGTVLEMPRNQVDEDKDTTCSYGLHFCSLSYLPHYHGGQGRVLIVKINPADVVAIPNDYNNAKGRAARYEVIGEHSSENNEAFTSPVYRGVDPVDPDEDSEDYEEDEWQAGYEAGERRAQKDSDTQRGYNDSAPIGYSEEFRDGYEDGYDQTYYVDWADAGHRLAEEDVAANLPYNDTPPDACDDHGAEYRTGYADGWHTAKVARI